jgi:hypothetical protein
LTLYSSHFNGTSYQYPIVMATPNPEATNPAAIPAKLAVTKKPDCWNDVHEAELKALAAAGEDAKSIVELMETSYPCLEGKLTEEWIREMVKGVKVAA